MTRRTKDAFKWIMEILRKCEISFQIQGGLAARIYGSHRRLADIDIGIPDNKLKELLPEVKRHIVYGPKRYIDENWDLLLMTLRYKGQEIDVFGNDSALMFDSKRKKWTKSRARLEGSEMKVVYDLRVPVIPKKELIEYKKALGRSVDISDIKDLGQRE